MTIEIIFHSYWIEMTYECFHEVKHFLKAVNCDTQIQNTSAFILHDNSKKCVTTSV